MDKLVIHGHVPLSGRLGINGAKNAALPIMAACLLTDQPCVIDNVPMIDDIRTMAELSRARLLASSSTLPVTAVTIQARKLNEQPYSRRACRQDARLIPRDRPAARANRRGLRAPPWGCAIGRRPVNVDVNALANMGADSPPRERRIRHAGEEAEWRAPLLRLSQPHRHRERPDGRHSRARPNHHQERLCGT